MCVTWLSLSLSLSSSLPSSSRPLANIGIFNLFHVIILSIFEFAFLFRCNESTNVCERARNSHFLSIASLLIPITYAVRLLYERRVPPIVHMWCESSGHRTKNKRQWISSCFFVIFCLLFLLLAELLQFISCGKIFASNVHIQAICRYIIYRHFRCFFWPTVTQLATIIARICDAVVHRSQYSKNKTPIELLLFLFTVKMMVITSSEVHKFWIESKKKKKERTCAVVAAACWIESLTYVLRLFRVCILIYLLRSNCYTNCV